MPTPTISPTTLLSLAVDHQQGSLLLTLSPWLVAIVLLALLVLAGVRWYRGSWRSATFEISTAEIGVGSGKISFRPNIRDQEIAYKIWVELSTRKIGLPIDLANDVIVEVYDSWHTFFSVTRELIKDIPVNRVKNSSTRQIVTLSIQLLNDGLRPHLTTWQARFRHWYDKQLADAKEDIDPQALQSQYTRFQELEKDLLAVNARLIRYRQKMRELVLGLTEEETKTTAGTEPRAPSL